MSGCAVPNWVDVALADLPTIVTIVTTILSIVAAAGGAVSPAVGVIITAAAAAINLAVPLIEDLVNQYKTNPDASIVAKIEAALFDVQSHLAAILDTAKILNPALRAIITTSVGLAVGVVTTILSLLPVPAPKTLAKKAQKTAQSGWASDPTNASNITKQFNAFLVASDYGSYVK